MKTRSRRFRVIIAVVSVAYALAVAYFIWSRSYIYLMNYEKNWFIIPGILLILSCFFVVRKAYVDRELLPTKVRLVLLLAGISFGLGGLAIIYLGIVSETLRWVYLPLLLLSFLSFQIMLIFVVLLRREYMKNLDKGV